VAHLEAHLPLALSGEDPEGVHQVRVAGRRLRAYLDLLGFRVLKDDLRFLVRQAGRVRDLEVALGGPLPQGFRGHLRAELAEARRSLVALLRSPWMGALLRALRHLPPLDKGRARKRLRRP
jgi:CHAD domain-containing protein